MIVFKHPESFASPLKQKSQAKALVLDCHVAFVISFSFVVIIIPNTENNHQVSGSEINALVHQYSL